MAQDWDIKSRSEACTACEKPFLDMQDYFAALTHGQEGYARTDLCDECWKAKKEELQAYSMWKGVFRLPPPPEEEALQKETAESLLRKLMEDDDESKINARYILAVMLERKKILIERDVKNGENGEKIRFYEHRQTGEMFVVPDPMLRLDELESVQEEVVLMLGGKVPEGKGSRAEPENLDDPEELRKHTDNVLAETPDPSSPEASPGSAAEDQDEDEYDDDEYEDD